MSGCGHKLWILLIVLLLPIAAEASSISLKPTKINTYLIVDIYLDNPDGLSGLQTKLIATNATFIRDFRGDACGWGMKANGWYMGVALGKNETCDNGIFYSAIYRPVRGKIYSIRTNGTLGAYPNGTGVYLNEYSVSNAVYTFPQAIDMNGDSIINVFDLLIQAQDD